MLAAELLDAAHQLERRGDRRRRRRLGRLVADPASRAFVQSLTDQVPRIGDPRRAAARFHDLVTRHGVPEVAGPSDRLALAAGARVAPVAPRPVMALVTRRLRREAAGVILPGEDPGLARHLARRTRAGYDQNVNPLGEAVLGEDEAAPPPRHRARHDRAGRCRLRVGEDHRHLLPGRPAGVRAHRRRAQRPAAHAVPRRAGGRPADVRQPGHGGLRRPPPHGRRVPPGARRGGVRRPRCRDRHPGLHPRLHGGPGRSVRLGSGAPRPIGRVDQGPRRQGRQPGHGAGGGRAAGLAAGTLDGESRGRRPLQAPAGPGARPRSGRGRAGGRGQPQPLRRGLGRRPGRGDGGHRPSRPRDARRDGPGPGRGGAPPGRAPAPLRARCRPRRLRGRHRLPRPPPRRERGAGELPPRPVRPRRGFARVGTTNAPASRRRSPDATPWTTGPGGTRTAPSRSRRATRMRRSSTKPDTDFTRAANRTWVAEHLASAADRWTATVAGSRPVDQAAVDRTVAVVAEAARRWAAQPEPERRRVLHRIADVLAARRGEAIAVMASETGKTIGRGRRRGVRGRRLRPLVRRPAASSCPVSRTTGWCSHRTGSRSSPRPGTSPWPSRPVACWPPSPPARASSSSRRRRPRPWAVSWPTASRRPACPTASSPSSRAQRTRSAVV